MTAPILKASEINYDSVRTLERASIRAFVDAHRGRLEGRVLDYGSGKPGTCRVPQPYRDLVSGEYVPYDLGDAWPNGTFDAILCTQAIQYFTDPAYELTCMASLLLPGGALVMTGPSTWSEVEEKDFWRFTNTGIRRLLELARFKVLEVEKRAALDLDGFHLSLGWGALAVKE